MIQETNMNKNLLYNKIKITHHQKKFNQHGIKAQPTKQTFQKTYEHPPHGMNDLWNMVAELAQTLALLGHQHFSDLDNVNQERNKLKKKQK